MAQTTGTTTITRKPQDGKSPVAYEIVPERTVYTSDETNELPFKVCKIVGEERTLLHEEIEGGTYVLESVLAGDVIYDEATDMYVLSDSGTFGYGDNCTVVLHLSSDDVVLATFTWGFTQSGKQGTTFSIRKWEDVKVGDKFRVESAEDGVLISDIVIYTDANGVTSKWICKKAFTVKSSGTTTKDNTTPKLGSKYWKAFDHYYNVATDLVLADKAIIDNLLLNNMSAYPKKEDGSWDTENPTVHIDGNTGEISLKGMIGAKGCVCIEGTYTEKNTLKGRFDGIMKEVDATGTYEISKGSFFFLTKQSYFIPKMNHLQEVTIIAANYFNVGDPEYRSLKGNFNLIGEPYNEDVGDNGQYFATELILYPNAIIRLVYIETFLTKGWHIISCTGKMRCTSGSSNYGMRDGYISKDLGIVGYEMPTVWYYD